MSQIAQQINTQPDINVIKAKMKASWEDGDYARFSKYMEPGAEEVLNSWNIKPGQRLLDVACGSGQTAIPAARNGAIVTGVDIAANLVEHARQRAVAEELEARFDEGDAEDLPCEDNEFDVAISMFGAMFAPRPEKVVSEFARVIKPGGRLIMANWTQASMPANMFKCVSQYVTPPPGFIPPVLWGNEETVTQRLENDFTDIQLTRKFYPKWDYHFSVDELVELFRTNFGPVKRAFEILDEAGQEKLWQELKQIYTNHSEINNGILTVYGQYLEVSAIRR